MGQQSNNRVLEYCTWLDFWMFTLSSSACLSCQWVVKRLGLILCNRWPQTAAGSWILDNCTCLSKLRFSPLNIDLHTLWDGHIGVLLDNGPLSIAPSYTGTRSICWNTLFLVPFVSLFVSLKQQELFYLLSIVHFSCFCVVVLHVFVVIVILRLFVLFSVFAVILYLIATVLCLFLLVLHLF